MSETSSVPVVFHINPSTQRLCLLGEFCCLCSLIMIGLCCMSALSRVWSAVMSRIRPFSIRVRFERRRLQSAACVRACSETSTRRMFHLFLFCVLLIEEHLWPSVPLVSASAGLRTNRTSVERHFNVTAFLVCLSYTLWRLNISLCQLHLEIVCSIVCCLSLKERLSHPAGVLVKVTLKFAHESPRHSVCPAAGTNIFLCIYSTSHNKAGLTKQCTILLISFI